MEIRPIKTPRDHEAALAKTASWTPHPAHLNARSWKISEASVAGADSPAARSLEDSGGNSDSRLGLDETRECHPFRPRDCARLAARRTGRAERHVAGGHLALASNPVQARKVPQTGALTGISIDLAQELGRRLSVPIVFDGRDIQGVMEAVRTGQADIGFLADEPSRRGFVTFSQTYLLNPQSVAVPEDSPIRRSPGRHQGRLGVPASAAHAEGRHADRGAERIGCGSEEGLRRGADGGAGEINASLNDVRSNGLLAASVARAANGTEMAPAP